MRVVIIGIALFAVTATLSCGTQRAQEIQGKWLAKTGSPSRSFDDEGSTVANYLVCEFDPDGAFNLPLVTSISGPTGPDIEHGWVTMYFTGQWETDGNEIIIEGSAVTNSGTAQFDAVLEYSITVEGNLLIPDMVLIGDIDSVVFQKYSDNLPELTLEFRGFQ